MQKEELVQFFKWDFESEEYLHQTSGYQTQKESIYEIWFNSFSGAKLYSIQQIKKQATSVEKKYSTISKELTDIENQTQAIDCLR